MGEGAKAVVLAHAYFKFTSNCLPYTY